MDTKNVELLEVKTSSVINEIGYDKQLKYLFVQFKGGRTYQYYEVPSIIFEKMKDIVAKGESIGKYFSANVRKKYKSAKL